MPSALQKDTLMKLPSFFVKRQRGAASSWIFAGFAVVALFFLFTEHRAHLYGWLPYLLLAACPLVHLFHGHGSHAGHGSHGADNEPSQRDQTLAPGSTDADAPVPPRPHQHH
jgi:DUF2933 family protein